MSKRVRCATCLKALSACICSTIKKLDNQYFLHILQDPSEEKKAIGTAKILSLSLMRVKISTAHYFKEQDFDLHNCFLIFPGENTISAQKLSLEYKLDKNSQFILLDGSWKKAYKLLMNKPFLQKLPRVSFSVTQKSTYRIRKSPREDGLSSVEAGYYLLSQLEQEETKYPPLLDSFNAMINYQIQKMPPSLYAKHYLREEE
ncbi:hypothetical protein JI57_00475 [Psychromonas sp. PRT-SC03]|nr:hypothetical protein JI57_00475 [Psychromonas sp. PRT-SC03]